MVCEKYSKLINDEALGGLSQERETELHEHLAHCVSCRNEFVRAKKLAAAMSAGVEMLVAGEPSSQFTAHLRARISNERVPAHPELRTWIPVAAGAFALAAVLMAAITRTPRQTPLDLAPVARSFVNPNAAIPAKTANRAADDSKRSARSRSHNLRASEPEPEPEVLVPPGQFVAVMQFANAMNAGRVDGEQIVTAQEQSEKPIESEAIQILPLTIPQIEDVNGTPESPGGF